MYDRFIQAHIYTYIHIHTIHTHTYTYALCIMHMLCILYVFPVSCLYINRTLNQWQLKTLWRGTAPLDQLGWGLNRDSSMQTA